MREIFGASNNRRPQDREEGEEEMICKNQNYLVLLEALIFFKQINRISGKKVFTKKDIVKLTQKILKRGTKSGE
jgi:hypothetical protein